MGRPLLGRFHRRGPVAKGLGVAELKKGARIVGRDREKLAGELRKKYDGGTSIRALAESTGRSYGFVHRVLKDSGTALRGRGGATRGAKKS
jgi:hypothetical protein